MPATLAVLVTLAVLGDQQVETNLLQERAISVENQEQVLPFRLTD
jgi:hypothetical protein